MKRLITLTLCLFALLGIAKADDDKPITINELPQKAREFIKQYFSKNAVSYAKMEKDFWDKKYDVVFVNGDKIEFDKNGQWEEIDCKFTVVPDTLIPNQIKDYVTNQFPRTKVLKIERNQKGFEVKLNNKLEIKFNPTFQVIGVDD